jgi:hypothetical protein
MVFKINNTLNNTMEQRTHRYCNKKIDYLMFVMLPLLAPPHPRLFFFFKLRPFTVLMRKTRQAVRAIKQSISLDVYEHTLKSVNNCLNANIYSYSEKSVACTINI